MKTRFNKLLAFLLAFVSAGSLQAEDSRAGRDLEKELTAAREFATKVVEQDSTEVRVEIAQQNLAQVTRRRNAMVKQTQMVEERYPDLLGATLATAVLGERSLRTTDDLIQTYRAITGLNSMQQFISQAPPLLKSYERRIEEYKSFIRNPRASTLTGVGSMTVVPLLDLEMSGAMPAPEEARKEIVEGLAKLLQEAPKILAPE